MGANNDRRLDTPRLSELAALGSLALTATSYGRVLGADERIDSKGNLYIADTQNNRIQKFSP